MKAVQAAFATFEKYDAVIDKVNTSSVSPGISEAVLKANKASIAELEDVANLIVPLVERVNRGSILTLTPEMINSDFFTTWSAQTTKAAMLTGAAASDIGIALSEIYQEWGNYKDFNPIESLEKYSKFIYEGSRKSKIGMDVLGQTIADASFLMKQLGYDFAETSTIMFRFFESNVDPGLFLSLLNRNMDAFGGNAEAARNEMDSLIATVQHYLALGQTGPIYDVFSKMGFSTSQANEFMKAVNRGVFAPGQLQGDWNLPTIEPEDLGDVWVLFKKKLETGVFKSMEEMMYWLLYELPKMTQEDLKAQLEGIYGVEVDANGMPKPVQVHDPNGAYENTPYSSAPRSKAEQLGIDALTTASGKQYTVASLQAMLGAFLPTYTTANIPKELIDLWLLTIDKEGREKAKNEISRYDPKQIIETLIDFLKNPSLYPEAEIRVDKAVPQKNSSLPFGVDAEAWAMYKATKGVYGENPLVGGAADTGEDTGYYGGYGVGPSLKDEEQASKDEQLISERTAQALIMDSKLVLNHRLEDYGTWRRSSEAAFGAVTSISREAAESSAQSFYTLKTAFGDLNFDITKMSKALEEWGIDVPTLFDYIVTGVKRVGEEMLESTGLDETYDYIVGWATDIKATIESLGLDLGIFWEMFVDKTELSVEEAAEALKGFNDDALGKLKETVGTVVMAIGEMWATGTGNWKQLWNETFKQLLSILINWGVKTILTMAATAEGALLIDSIFKAITGDWAHFGAAMAGLAIVAAGTAGWIAAIKAIGNALPDGTEDDESSGGKDPWWDPDPDANKPGAQQPGRPEGSGPGASSVEASGRPNVVVHIHNPQYMGQFSDSDAAAFGQAFGEALIVRGVMPQPIG